MNSKFCSILAAKEGEPIYGSAPEKNAAIFLPVHKTMWHHISAKEHLESFSKTCDLNTTISLFKHPLIVFYSPNEQTGNYIFVSDPSGIKSFSNSGSKTEKEVKYIYATCTDGVKDACCAKFGIPIAKAFFKKCIEDPFAISFETSHLGGCRFAATAICFPSGNSYGRITSEDVPLIKRSEEDGLIVPTLFRGNIYVSEIHCWVMRYCMENFGYVPSETQTQVVKEEDRFHIKITTEQRHEIKFNLLHRDVQLTLFSGCSNIESGRSTTRTVYDFSHSDDLLR